MLLASPPPTFDRQNQTSEGFALEIEEYCGDHAKGMLQSEFGPHTINPQSLLRDEAQIAAFGCVLNVAILADFDLGFIGNEKGAEQD